VRAESLREVIQAEPFRPFEIVLVSGSRILVTHPEWVLYPKGARTAIVWYPDDRVRIIDVGLVLELDLAPPVAAGSIAPNPNGGSE
jgi:hypothetical protein